MARRPWCSRHRAADNDELRSAKGRRGSRRAELVGLDAVALDLDVKSFVVHSKQPCRLAFVPSRGLKGQTDRLPLRFGGGPAGDLLQRETHLFFSVVISHHGAARLTQLADQ